MTTPNFAIAEAIQTALDTLAPPTNGQWVAPLVAQIRNNGDIASVSDYYCGFCRSEDCGHVLRVRREWDEAVAIAADDRAARDYHDEMSDRRAVMAGVA